MNIFSNRYVRSLSTVFSDFHSCNRHFLYILKQIKFKVIKNVSDYKFSNDNCKLPMDSNSVTCILSPIYVSELPLILEIYKFSTNIIQH